MPITEGGKDHVEHAGHGAQARPELSLELGPHRCAKVAASQRCPGPAGIDVGSHQGMGGEGDQRINRSRWRRQNLDHAIGGRKADGGCVPKHIGQPMLFSPKSGSSGGVHGSSLTETVCRCWPNPAIDGDFNRSAALSHPCMADPSEALDEHLDRDALD